MGVCPNSHRSGGIPHDHLLLRRQDLPGTEKEGLIQGPTEAINASIFGVNDRFDLAMVLYPSQTRLKLQTIGASQ